MLKKKYYDGFTVHDILNKHLDDGHKILELLTAFADADGIDAVEVVRCKDCVYKNEYGYCTLYINFHHLTEDMAYCSDAERKEE